MEALGIRSNSLSAEDLPTRVPNVFVLDWALRSSVFPIESLKPQFHGNMDRSQTILQRGETPQIFGLPYNPRWIHLAEDISSVLGSYVVVRWNPDISGSCKSSFLRSLQTIPSDSSNSRIYAVYITAESLSRLPQSTERSSDRMAGDTPDQALSSLRKELRTHGILQGKKLASLTDVLRAFSKHDPSGRSDEDGLVEALTTGDIDWALRAFVDDRVVSGAQLVIDASETCGKGGE
ncbi:hypothetical protein FRB99_003130 [Tulasnella sp. 403]|nr:hypothetical protein FRB99_003130 [Tulasnella sp. 403]